MQWGWWLRTEEWRLVGMRQMTAEPRPVMMMMAGVGEDFGVGEAVGVLVGA
jgi:hypothetical protein